MLGENRADGDCDIVDVALGHRGKERQRQNALGGALGAGKIAGPVAERFLIIRLHVQRRKMNAGADVRLF